MTIKRKEVVYFLLFAIIFIFFANIFAVKNDTIHSIKTLRFSDTLYIFQSNLEYVLIMFLFSFTGLNLLFIAKVFITFGQGPSHSGINPLIYYTCSLFHGMGELIVCCIVFYFTINQFKIVGGYFLGKRTTKDIKLFYLKVFKYYLPTIVFILYVSSLMEVYISNRLIKIFWN